jgi:hypothetical protein
MEWLKKILKEAGIENADDLEGKISKELPKHFKPANEFNEVNEKLKSANAEIETLKVTNSNIQTEYDNYKKGSITQEEYETKVKEIQDEADAKVKKNDFDSKLSLKLMGKEINAKDSKDIIANIDISKISLDGDNFIGLDEQIKSLKERKSYLFNEEQTIIEGQEGAGKQKINDGKPDLGKMSYDDICKYLEENPDAEI